MSYKNQTNQKLVRCRSCKELFTPDKYKSGMKYCNNPKCQQEKKNRNQRAQKKRNKLNEVNNTLPIGLKRHDKICICCKVKKVPKKKIRGVYLSVLCEDCFRHGESDVLDEHRVLCEK